MKEKNIKWIIYKYMELVVMLILIVPLTLTSYGLGIIFHEVVHINQLSLINIEPDSICYFGIINYQSNNLVDHIIGGWVTYQSAPTLSEVEPDILRIIVTVISFITSIIIWIIVLTLFEDKLKQIQLDAAASRTENIK